MNTTARPGKMRELSETPAELNEEIMRATVAEVGVCGEFSLRPTNVSMFANLLGEETNMSYQITVCETQPSDVLDTDLAKDVEVRVEGAGISYTGTVTVDWDNVNKRYAAFGGDPSAWVDPELLQVLQRAYGWDGLRGVLQAIEASADNAARAFDAEQTGA